MSEPSPAGGRLRALNFALGLLALVLALAVAGGQMLNRTLEQSVESDRAAMTKGQALANINNGLIRLMAKTAAEKNDAELRDLLARNGVTFKVSDQPTEGKTP